MKTPARDILNALIDRGDLVQVDGRWALVIWPLPDVLLDALEAFDADQADLEPEPLEDDDFEDWMCG